MCVCVCVCIILFGVQNFIKLINRPNLYMFKR